MKLDISASAIELSQSGQEPFLAEVLRVRTAFMLLFNRLPRVRIRGVLLTRQQETWNLRKSGLFYDVVGLDPMWLSVNCAPTMPITLTFTGKGRLVVIRFLLPDTETGAIPRLER